MYPQTLVVEEKKNNSIGLVFAGIFMLLMCLGCLIAGIAILNDLYIAKGIIILAVGIIGLVFFGFCFVFIIKRAIHPQPLCTLSAEGLTDTSSAAPAGFLPWYEIAGAELKSTMGNIFVVVHLRDTSGYIAKLSPVRRKLAQYNIKLGYSPVSIRTQGIQGITPDQLAWYINAYRQAYYQQTGY